MELPDNINGVNGSRPIVGFAQPLVRRATQQVITDKGDRLDLSVRASEIARRDRESDFRSDHVARVRAEIVDGSYESDRKIDETVNRLFADLVALDLHV